jgi:hypothetical protein
MAFVRDLILSAGKTIVLLGCLSSLVLAVGYLFLPEILKSISKPVNQLFSIEDWLFVNRVLAGVTFAVVALVLFGVFKFV